MRYTIKGLKKEIWRVDQISITYNRKRLLVKVETTNGKIDMWEGKTRKDKNIIAKMIGDDLDMIREKLQYIINTNW